MLYVSKYSELRLVHTPAGRTLDDKGRVIPIPGKRVEFIGGRYMTDDPEMIDWLHQHHLRGIMFDEVRSDEVETIQKQITTPQTKIADGAMSTSTLPGGPVCDSTIAARPEDKIALTSDLQEIVLRVVDERIGKALGEIMELLKKDSAKEEKVLEGKPRKTFRCPYCQTEFKSGFECGSHKKTCDKKPQ